MPDRVTCLLIYLAIGAVIWAFLKASRILDRGRAMRQATAFQFAAANVVVILAWPHFMPPLWRKAWWFVKRRMAR